MELGELFRTTNRAEIEEKIRLAKLRRGEEAEQGMYLKSMSKFKFIFLYTGGVVFYSV